MDMQLPHRRLNALSGEWVLVSPHRDKRPWLGQVEKLPPDDRPAYDPVCYLCPGNERAGGVRNPVYTGTFVFDNDFPALLPPSMSEIGEIWKAELFVAEEVAGICRVVCFSPRHHLSLPEMAQAEVEEVVRIWSQQTRELGGLGYIRYVQVFENKGAIMGASNPHPHSQIWATQNIPDEPAKELHTQRKYSDTQGGCLLCDYLAEETRMGERIVCQNTDFAALVPFWAVWPFELLVISKRHLGSLPDLTTGEAGNLAALLREVTARYDNLFEISFPYSMGFHQAPVDGEVHPEWHLHMHFYPPLLRSATVRKFMVGFEMLGMPQRDLTAETAAVRLRACDAVHYKQR
jgi:UDPglucose--hexose-1-phosphate uridylyltransferase